METNYRKKIYMSHLGGHFGFTSMVRSAFDFITEKYEIKSILDIDFKNETELRWTIIDFNSSNHQIEYCENEYQDATYICSIDNKLWYGSDSRMDLPKNELKSLIFFVEKKLIKCPPCLT